MVHETDHSPSACAKVQNAPSLHYCCITRGQKNRKKLDTFNFRAVTDSINYLIDVCTSAAPGQKECDNAIRKIQSMRPLLDNPTEPHNDSTYFECLDTVMEKSKSLGEFRFHGFLICLFLSTYIVLSFGTLYPEVLWYDDLIRMVYRIWQVKVSISTRNMVIINQYSD